MANTTKIANIAELKTRKGRDNSIIQLEGYYTIGDGAEGDFRWDDNSILTDNGGTVIEVTGVTIGRWLRVFDNTIEIKWFGANTNLANNSIVIQNAINEAQTKNLSLLINGDVGEYICTTPLLINSRITILGEGTRNSRLTFNMSSGFEISAGTTYVSITNIRISILTRYTDAIPNNFTGIYSKGLTANQCYWHTYRDLFIDGFQTGIQLDGTWASTIENTQISFSFNGIVSNELASNNTITNNKLTGIFSANSSGIKIGDGTNQSEGWLVNNNVIFGYYNGIYSFGTPNNIFSNNVLDSIQDTGIFLRSSATAPSMNNIITNNYIALNGSLSGHNIANAGIWILNGVSIYDADNRGTTISNNQILAYTANGSTVSYGIFAEGSYTKRNIIKGNKIAASLNDIRLQDDSPIGSIVTDNILFGTGCYITGSTAETIIDSNVGLIISANSSIKTTHGRQTAYYNVIPPVAGNVGDITWNETPVSGGFVGWVCTVGGAVATWKSFGLIS